MGGQVLTSNTTQQIDFLREQRGDDMGVKGEYFYRALPIREVNLPRSPEAEE